MKNLAGEESNALLIFFFLFFFAVERVPFYFIFEA